MIHSTSQLGFDGLLLEAEESNRVRRFERETGHLPGTMDEGLVYYRDLIDRHNAAMLSAEVQDVMQMREEAHKLALRLNAGEPGIIAGPDAPGCILERETAAPSGTAPLWGQTGTFEIEYGEMRVRIALEGIFGIGATVFYWPGFSAHVVEPDKPFLSGTGYRSFLGLSGDPMPGMAPQDFAAGVIRQHIERDLKGKLVMIEERYRD